MTSKARVRVKKGEDFIDKFKDFCSRRSSRAVSPATLKRYGDIIDVLSRHHALPLDSVTLSSSPLTSYTCALGSHLHYYDNHNHYCYATSNYQDHGHVHRFSRWCSGVLCRGGCCVRRCGCSCGLNPLCHIDIVN